MRIQKKLGCNLLRFVAITLAILLPIGQSASATGADDFCPSIRAVFQQVATKLKGSDIRTGFANNAKAIVKDENLRTMLHVECPKMAKGVEVMAKKTPNMGSDAWKEAVLDILSP